MPNDIASVIHIPGVSETIKKVGIKSCSKPKSIKLIPLPVILFISSFYDLVVGYSDEENVS